MRIVLKFGGTSVADIGRLENVALKIKKEVEAGHKVAVVVSAMAGVTNQLVHYTHSIAGKSFGEEYDAVVATGEQITTGLLALSLQQINVPAKSFMGWQVPIYTNSSHGNAQIQSVNSQKLLQCWENSIVPIISGFQGITRQQRITTLGRGGSDTTAVAIAAALDADRCDIYTDVDGVYTSDPRVVPQARKLETIGYDEMLALSFHGAKVLHAPCVEIAKKHQVNVHVRSSFNDTEGTTITPQENNFFQSRLTGITHSLGWAKLKLYSELPLSPQAHLLLKILHENKIPTETVECNQLEDSPHLSVLIPQSSLTTILQSIEKYSEKNKKIFNFFDIILENSLAKITLIGLNLISKKGFYKKLLKHVSQSDSIISLITMAPDQMSLSVSETMAEDLVRSLHHYFELDKTPHATLSFLPCPEPALATGT